MQLCVTHPCVKVSVLLLLKGKIFVMVSLGLKLYIFCKIIFFKVLNWKRSWYIKMIQERTIMVKKKQGVSAILNKKNIVVLPQLCINKPFHIRFANFTNYFLQILLKWQNWNFCFLGANSYGKFLSWKSKYFKRVS